jgi:anti-anti-sigma factor
MADKFQPAIEGNTAKFTISGRLDAANAPELSEALKELIGKSIENIVFFVEELSYISSAGLRAIAFAKQKIGADTKVYVIKPQQDVIDVIKMTGFDSFIIIQDTFEG